MTVLGIILGIMLAISITLFVIKKRRDDALRAIEEQKEQERQAQLIEAKICDTVESLKPCYKQYIDHFYNVLLHSEHYFTASEKDKFINETKDHLTKLEFLHNNNALERLENADRLLDAIQGIDTIRKEHNEKFVNKEMLQQSEFFDNILDYPLDNQQRESIVKLEDNCLVISSAGSGKTSTMIGKLLYLVRQRKVDPSRILTITYTHKASDELTTRLKGTGLSCMTFHKLAMTIIAHIEGKKPSIAGNDLFIKVFYDQLSNSIFRNAILNYLTDYKSLVKEEHSYLNSVDYYRDRKKYGVIALYPDKDGKTIFTKSEEEKKICSYLTELGIAFKYEEPYEHEVYTEEYRQYRPDFTIYYTDKSGAKRKLYLEHYALDALGNVPKWFGNGRPDGWFEANQRYKEGVEWKANTHNTYHTQLIYTQSADFHRGNIRTHLRDLLTKAGVPIHEQTSDSLMNKIISRNKSLENALMQMTQSFINLVKANGKSVDEIRDVAQQHNSKRDIFVIDNIMKPLWDGYQQALAQNDEMDFTDAIIKATKYCNEHKWTKKYDYILIDEFQDISIDRYRFLQALRTDTPMTKLYCVGDDWQSIYRFSGSDLSLFSEFPKYFGFTELCKIETTYRFGDPLIKESSQFIQNNPLQHKKNVHPRTVNPPETKLSFVGYNDNTHLQSLLQRMIPNIPAGKSAYIISRYSFDVRALASPQIGMEYINDNVMLTIANRRIKFMTIHGSKGLEADYVFLINCNSGLYGFPSLISDDPVLDYVLSNPEHFEYAEERRVFYVGITRAKTHTVVLYCNNTPSPFVTEINHVTSQNPEQCPWCGTGHRIVKYQGLTKQKTPYTVWGCDNKEANCQYFEREFVNTPRFRDFTRPNYRQDRTRRKNF